MREPIGQLLAGRTVIRGAARQAAVDHDVGLSRKFHQCPAVSLPGRIQDDGPLVRVVQRERDAYALNRRQVGPSRAATRRFDLEHVGAQVGK